jgi:hypothetical protein
MSSVLGVVGCLSSLTTALAEKFEALASQSRSASTAQQPVSPAATETCEIERQDLRPSELQQDGGVQGFTGAEGRGCVARVLRKKNDFYWWIWLKGCCYWDNCPAPGLPGAWLDLAVMHAHRRTNARGGVVSYQDNELRLLRQSRWPFARNPN